MQPGFNWQDLSVGSAMQNVGFYFLLAIMLLIIFAQLKIGGQTGHHNVAHKINSRFYGNIIQHCANSFVSLKRLWRGSNPR